MKEQWILNGRQADFTRIACELSVPPLAVKLMVNRGIEEKDMRGFLSGSLSELSDPYLMKDMKKACDILLTAAEHNDTVAIVTDYDCDGIFSGMALYTCFNRIGIRAKLFTPDRVTEGYGLNKRIIDEAYNMGINYLITCDNGIAAADEVLYAKSLGMTVIITDHHEVPFTVNDECKEYILPKADAVIDSKQEDCAYPFKGLCGAGVVYRMACALYDRLGIKKNEREILLIYAAVATVADIMELTGENRIIVKEGLKLLSHTDNIGLKSIKEVNNLADAMITPYHIGFVIGPCFNAAGRLKNVEPAFELLISNDEKVVYDRALELKELNEYRKDMTEFMEQQKQISRDNARTPMQWDDTPNAGFSSVTPWLKVNAGYRKVNVAVEEKNPDSVLNYFRKMIAFRKANPELIFGTWKPVDRKNPKVFAYIRDGGERKFLVILNFSCREASCRPGICLTGAEALLDNYNDCPPLGKEIRLRPFEALVLIL